jgi:hypothetical protein
MEVSAQLHAQTALPPGKSPPDYTGGWVGPTAGLEAVKKNVATAGNGTPTVQPVVCRYTDWAIPTPASLR